MTEQSLLCGGIFITVTTRGRHVVSDHSIVLQQLVHVNSKENVKSPHYVTFLVWIYQWPVDSPHKGPVIRKVFPHNDVIMRCLVCQYLNQPVIRQDNQENLPAILCPQRGWNGRCCHQVNAAPDDGVMFYCNDKHTFDIVLLKHGRLLDSNAQSTYTRERNCIFSDRYDIIRAFCKSNLHLIHS